MAESSEPARDALTAELEALTHLQQVMSLCARPGADFDACLDSIRRVVENLRGLVAERESLLKAEQDARMDAEREAELKGELLAMLSHDLRSPIQAVLGWVSILMRNPRPEDLKTGLETIERNSRAQARIISDLLDMSWVVSGRFRLDVQAIDYEAIVDEAIATIQPAADERNIRIDKSLDPLAGIAPRGDPGRLHQVVWHLLNNAVKFTPHGGSIRISLERIDTHAELRVADTGVGIDAERLPHVFEHFRGLSAGANHRAGLGLALVKSIVEAHGGSVRAESAGEGKGATFIVGIPLAVNPAA